MGLLCSQQDPKFISDCLLQGYAPPPPDPVHPIYPSYPAAVQDPYLRYFLRQKKLDSSNFFNFSYGVEPAKLPFPSPQLEASVGVGCSQSFSNSSFPQEFIFFPTAHALIIPHIWPPGPEGQCDSERGCSEDC